MPDKQSQEKKKPEEMTLGERLVEKSIKTMEKNVADETTNRLQAGQQPNQVLEDLLRQVSTTRVDKPKTMRGILPALLQAIQGQGFQPFAPRQEELGIERGAKYLKDLLAIQESLRPEEEKHRIELEHRAEQEIQTEKIKGVSGEVAGRIALAKESLKNVDDIKTILFPNWRDYEAGKTQRLDFQRWTAMAANIPGGQLPGIPSKIAWGRKAPQDLFRKMGAIISGRQLIQTGVAARPEETAKLITQFAPTLFSNAESALQGLNELKEFYNIYLRETDPKTRFREEELPEGLNPDEWEIIR